MICHTAVGQNPYAAYFQQAYQLHPTIPRGMLEAISYTQTHVRNIMPDEAAGCSGIPQYVGVMGLIEDGKGVFRENLRWISSISGIPLHHLSARPDLQIQAFAFAYSYAHREIELFTNEDPNTYLPVLTALSELPLDTTVGADYALNSYLYSVLSFLNNPTHAATYGFPVYHIDLRQAFGANYDILSSSYITMSSQGITNLQGQQYGNSRMAAEYPNALWNPAASCNYSTRGGVAISAVTIHTIQGSYAGAISWFKNCNASVSAHYVLRSSDGQVTQMVPETNKAWHVGSENPYTVGLEHEGYVNDPSWYTQAMYQSSANLVKYLAAKYAINPLSTYKGVAQVVLNSCYRIKGHVHFPNQTHTDPGINWNWQLYYNLINNTIATNTITTCSGTFTDNGGTNGNYTDLTKYLTVIQPAGAASVTMNFTSFSLEQGYDSLYIYDGNGTGGILLGRYTGTQNPGTVTANSGVMSLLFTSDCNTNSTGWVATYSCAACPGTLAVVVDSLMPVTCNPGYIRVTGTGGTPPYTYVWGNGTPGPVRTNMPVGAFTVSVTDGAGCMVSKVFSIPSTPNPTVQLSANPILCNGGKTNITAAPSAGTAPYSYVWNVTGSTATLTNVGAGSYSLTLTDGAGCTATASTTITQPASIVINTDSLSDASCLGGYIAVSASGGNSPITLRWNDGSTSAIRSGLNAGNYTVVATDANGCTVSKGFTLSNISSIAISATVDTLNCPGDADASITITATGGTTPYGYLWTNGATTAQITNLVHGTYSLTLIDAVGCLASATFVIAQPDSLLVDATVSQVTCFGNSDGAINLTPISGKAPFQYQWNVGSGSALAQLQPGSYLLTVTDARGCQTTDSYTITQPSNLVITTDSVADVSCLDAGYLAISATGGVGPYTYLWNDGDTMAVLSNLIAGSYSLTVSDANGCTEIGNYTVANISGLTVTNQIDTLVCPDDANASITIATIGGTAPYSYQWNIGQTSAQLSNLSAGTYTVTISDNAGCAVVQTIAIAAPATLVVDAAVRGISCAGDGNGSITLAPTSGLAPFQYQWSTGGIGASLTLLQAGNYLLTVTDARGCSITDSYSILEPAPLQVWRAYETFDSIGLAWDSITGGTAQYNIEHLECWIYLGQIAGDPARECSLRVRDGNGCLFDTIYPFGQWQSVGNITATNINIYPNPTNGIVSVTWQGAFVRYHLVNTLGQTLIEGNITSTENQLQLNLQPYAMGSYWLVMENKDGQRATTPLLRAQ
jgi:N-acetyl-anhydromuramyl-L-alanine amidase AmpD